MSESVKLVIPANSSAGPDPSKPAEATSVTEDGTSLKITTAQPLPVEPGTEKSTVEPAPKLLAGKYKTPEDMEKAYLELQKKLSAPKEKEAPSKTEAAPKATDAEAAAVKAGVDLKALEAEYAKEGALSEASVKMLEEKGFDKATVDAFIEGRKAVADKFTAELAESVGGKESFDSIIEWAAANLTAEEIDAANDELASGNKAKASLVLKGIKAQYTAANGTEPNLVKGEAVAPVGIEPFADQSEIIKAMRSKEYKTSAAFRAKVEARLAVSK